LALAGFRQPHMRGKKPHPYLAPGHPSLTAHAIDIHQYPDDRYPA
jgi:hypothetical protein